MLAIFWIVSFVYSHKIFELVQFFLWAFLGVYHFTDGFGLEKEFFEVLENGLKVKLQNRIKPVVVLNSDIEKISLRKLEIIVYRVKNKPVVFKRKYLEPKHMNEVYNFFIEYATARHIDLIRDFNQK